jgi:hypothetical protein
MCPDPYHQYFSSYLSMGNNPMNRFDPDGGSDGEWFVDVETGTKTKVNNMGDDIGMDFVHYTRTHSDGAIESLGSFTASSGSWGGKLISRSSPLSYHAKENIFNGQIRNSMDQAGNFIFEYSLKTASYVFLGSRVLSLAKLPARLIANSSLTGNAAEFASMTETYKLFGSTVKLAAAVGIIDMDYATIGTQVLSNYNPKLAKRLDIVIHIHGGVKGTPSTGKTIKTAVKIGNTIAN